MEFTDEDVVPSAQAVQNGLEYVLNTMRPKGEPKRVESIDVEALGEIECYEGTEVDPIETVTGANGTN